MDSSVLQRLRKVGERLQLAHGHRRKKRKFECNRPWCRAVHSTLASAGWPLALTAMGCFVGSGTWLDIFVESTTRTFSEFAPSALKRYNPPLMASYGRSDQGFGSAPERPLDPAYRCWQCREKGLPSAGRSRCALPTHRRRPGGVRGVRSTSLVPHSAILWHRAARSRHHVPLSRCQSRPRATLGCCLHRCQQLQLRRWPRLRW